MLSNSFLTKRNNLSFWWSMTVKRRGGGVLECRDATNTGFDVTKVAHILTLSAIKNATLNFYNFDRVKIIPQSSNLADTRNTLLVWYMSNFK